MNNLDSRPSLSIYKEKLTCVHSVRKLAVMTNLISHEARSYMGVHLLPFDSPAEYILNCFIAAVNVVPYFHFSLSIG